MGQRIERRRPARNAKTNQENVPVNPKCEHWTNTLDEYRKRLVDIERKCKFNRITTKEIITYIFAATIINKKARDKFIEGPLELPTDLEIIELDSYDRKYGNKKQKTEDNILWQLMYQQTNCFHKAGTVAKTVWHRQEENMKPKLPLLQQIELDPGTFMPGTESIML